MIIIIKISNKYNRVQEIIHLLVTSFLYDVNQVKNQCLMIIKPKNETIRLRQ